MPPSINDGGGDVSVISSPAVLQTPHVPLAPGFRFHPTDEELVAYYLRRRVRGQRLRLDAIAEVEIYKHEPWHLPSMSRLQSRDVQWYFFSPLDRKLTGAGAGGRGCSSAAGRLNRATKEGYWKTTGKDREVWHRGRVVGMKKTLVYHNGRAPKGARTNWVMHEYRLQDESSVALQVQDMYVVCKIFQKNGSGPMNGSQYGAPLLEEDWEEEAVEGSATVVDMMTDNGEREFGYSNADEYLQQSDIDKNSNGAGVVEVPALPAGSDTLNTDSNREILYLSLDDLEAASEGQFIENVDDERKTVVLDGSSSSPDCLEQVMPNQVCEDENYPDALCWPNMVSSNWPLIKSNKQKFDKGVDRVQNLHKLLNVEEYFDLPQEDELVAPDFMSNDQGNSIPSTYTQSTDLSTPFSASTSDMLNDGNVALFDETSIGNFYDANDSFIDLDSFLYSPVNCLSEDTESDLIGCLDATENTIKYHSVGSAENYNYCPTDNTSSPFKVDVIQDETSNSNALYGQASTSTQPWVDIYPVGGKASYPTNAAGKQGYDKASENCLVNVLGSIYAPAAFAEEIVGASAKIAALAGGPVRVNAGIIQISGTTTFSEGSGKEVTSSSSNINLLLSLSVGDGIPATTKENGGGSMVLLLRGGFYAFFVSSMIFALAYKLGSGLLLGR